MKKLHQITAVVAILCLAVSFGAARQEKSDGKIVFVDKKCGGCHSVEAAGIVKKSASTSKQGPPDLSTVGTSVDSAFIAKFLKKDTTLNGKKHLIRFNGSQEDFTALIQWLTSLKAPADTMKK
ncbi:MAG: c-type cytochrome [Ignavibacteriales bacterium]|nr:c-type cytochrome [Ignavibacteriales bacterium]